MIASKMLEEAVDDFDVEDCFQILKAVSQEVCPTVVSMVFDATEMTVYWCENRQFENLQKKSFPSALGEQISICRKGLEK